MSSLRAALERARAGDRRAGRVIAYLTLGDPDPHASRAAALELAAAGCVALELGLPTPSATENEALTRSHRRAATACTPAQVLALASELARDLPCPVILLGYWSALGDLTGLESFLDAARASGAAAVLVVGLPIAHVTRMGALATQRALETVLTIGSTTPAPIRDAVLRATTGCIYLAPRGRPAREELTAVRAITELPVIVGGGVATATQVAELCAAGAAAAVLGAAVVERVEQALPLAPWIDSLRGA